MRKRTCWITGILVLAQVGIVAGYYTVLQGDAAPPLREVTQKPTEPPRTTPDKQELPTPTGAAAVETPPLSGVAPLAPETKSVPLPPVEASAAEKTAEGKKDKTPEPPPPPPMADSAKAEPPDAVPPLASETVIKVTRPPAPSSGPTPPKVEDPLIQTSATNISSGITVTPLPESHADVEKNVKALGTGIAPGAPLTIPTSGPGKGPPDSGPVVGNPVPANQPPVLISTPEKKSATPKVCPWTLRVALVDGKTQLIAQSGKEVQFRVTCNQLTLQAPNGTIEAQGAVHLTSTGLEGDGERMTISWQEDLVVLDGQAQVKCHRDGQDLELRAVRLSLRLTPVPPAATKNSHSPRTYDDQEESSAEEESGVSGD